MKREAAINMEAITNILAAVEGFFTEAGCPLTDAQREALAGPRAHAERVKADAA
jgi:hypothetical protein